MIECFCGAGSAVVRYEWPIDSANKYIIDIYIILKDYEVHLSWDVCPLCNVKGGLLVHCCSKLLPHLLLTRSQCCSVTRKSFCIANASL